MDERKRIGSEAGDGLGAWRRGETVCGEVGQVRQGQGQKGNEREVE